MSPEAELEMFGCGCPACDDYCACCDPCWQDHVFNGPRRAGTARKLAAGAAVVAGVALVAGGAWWLYRRPETRAQIANGSVRVSQAAMRKLRASDPAAFAEFLTTLYR